MEQITELNIRINKIYQKLLCFFFLQEIKSHLVVEKV